ncbi:hypothetical protein ACWV27_26615 (plasmid) [Massilia varians]|uniref:hypothetical protein n=1 Tax=Pseudomonadota TaxID=1224 RepID=UPI001C87A78C
MLVVAYALSRIHLIPDFIPGIELPRRCNLLPCLIWVAVRLIPSYVLAECRGTGQ